MTTLQSRTCAVDNGSNDFAPVDDAIRSVEGASVAPFNSGDAVFSFLVVDDDQDAANSLADVLRLAGHDCVVA